MSIFKKIYEEKTFFSKKHENKYSLVLAIESSKDSFILTYLDGKIKSKLSIKKENISNYKFLQRTRNLFYNKYKPVSSDEVIKEMVTGDVGIGGTAPDQWSGDFYAKGDARNVTSQQFPMTRRPKITDTIFGGKKKKKKKGKNGKKQKK